MKLLVFNKVDLIKSREILDQLQTSYPNSVFISASRHIGLTQLKEQIINLSESQYEIRELVLRYSKGASDHLVYPFARVLKQRSDETFLYLSVKYDLEYQHKIKEIQDKYQ